MEAQSPFLGTVIKLKMLFPNLHTTLFQRPSNVRNIHITLDERWNNFMWQLVWKNCSKMLSWIKTLWLSWWCLPVCQRLLPKPVSVNEFICWFLRGRNSQLKKYFLFLILHFWYFRIFFLYQHLNFWAFPERKKNSKPTIQVIKCLF